MPPVSRTTPVMCWPMQAAGRLCVDACKKFSDCTFQSNCERRSQFRPAQADDSRKAGLSTMSKAISEGEYALTMKAFALCGCRYSSAQIVRLQRSERNQVQNSARRKFSFVDNAVLFHPNQVMRECGARNIRGKFLDGLAGSGAPTPGQKPSPATT